MEIVSGTHHTLDCVELEPLWATNHVQPLF